MGHIFRIPTRDCEWRNSVSDYVYNLAGLGMKSRSLCIYQDVFNHKVITSSNQAIFFSAPSIFFLSIINICVALLAFVYIISLTHKHLKSRWLLLFLFYVCKCPACFYKRASHQYLCWKKPKEVLDPLELEVEVIGS